VGITKVQLWLTRLGVELIHGRVCHPQAQGKEERFHRTLKAEVLNRESFWRDLKYCQGAFDHWQKIYNEKRPHDSLDGETPSSRYRLSKRSYPGSLPEAESFYCWKSIGEINLKEIHKQKGRYHSIRTHSKV
jgi:hypothetical protein